MSEHDDRIEQLVQTVPTIHRTFWQKVSRVGAVLAAVVAFVSLAVAITAALNTSDLANCTNTNLGERNAPSRLDAQAHISYAKASQMFVVDIVKVFSAPPNSAEQRAAFRVLTHQAVTYAAASTNYVDQLVADQASRNSHPLGKC